VRHGIYSKRRRRPHGTVHDRVASYGRRPTFDDGDPLLEVYLFDFSGDLYGEEVEVVFFDWIRAEEQFSSVAELVAAIEKDCVAAKAILAAATPPSPLDLALAEIG
jgi:riboflavin kinase/FMN adenylyltransferase